MAAAKKKVAQIQSTGLHQFCAQSFAPQRTHYCELWTDFLFFISMLADFMLQDLCLKAVIQAFWNLLSAANALQ